MLVQFVITWDDIVNNANASPNGTTITAVTGAQTSYGNPATVLRQVNLYGGRYRARVDGFHIETGAFNTTTYGQNPQIININSSKFHFPAGGASGLNFTTNSFNVMADLKGHREFEINTINGTIDLTFYISQYGQNVNSNVAAVVAPWTVDKTATWTSAQFAYLILSLDLEACDDKALFGQAKGAFSQ